MDSMQHYIIASSNPLQKDKDRTAAEKKFVASRPAAGGESCNAGFYFQSIGNCVKSSKMVYVFQLRGRCCVMQIMSS